MKALVTIEFCCDPEERQPDPLVLVFHRLDIEQTRKVLVTYVDGRKVLTTGDEAEVTLKGITSTPVE